MALQNALIEFDAGNHHFPSKARAELAESISQVSLGLKYSVFTTSGSEAIDVAVKTAPLCNRATQDCLRS